MIILFEVNEKKFNTLGLGVLTDAISCHVKEKLLDEFTIEMRYPVKGKHFSKIQYDRIIYCKPNPYDEAQPFRIIFISKPIKGEITIDAVHISYDLNNIPMNAFSSSNLQDLINKIQNEALITHDFKFSSEVMSVKTYKTTSPYNLRAILMGGDNSVVSEYDAELKFNNFLINIMPKRGKNRGAIVRYGHNMTDINHDISTELLYNGVFPFYHRETEKNEVSTNDSFTQVYIVGSKPLQDGWLSFSRDGQPYHPLDTTPVQIASEGDYFQKVYVWDDIYNVYREKVYNQAVTLIQGVLEPDWIRIDWSAFPNVICKAGKKGYFKLATDTDWGDIKGVGDTIFEESIISSGIIENMIIYYSEVIPNNKESTNSDTTEIVDVQLDEKILWLDTKDALAMKYTKILSLDLTSEFEEEPSKERLLAKAEEFINKNKIGTIKHTTKVSFIDLASTTEKSKYENFDHIELGDTVKIVYEDANISVDLRVISTQYDAILNKYESIELGEKKDTMSSESIQNGDNVSSLTNDVGYATVTTVNKLIADVVTANYIEALNAKLTQAQISELEVQRINVKGILEASQFSLDSLIARLLVAENADIAKTLTAGSIKVSGDISIKSGEIRLASEDETTLFTVDRGGNVTANAIEITGGTLNINDGVFEVTNEGVLTAKNALIEGEIKATTGQIGGFKIQNENLYTETGLGVGVFISEGSADKAEIGGSDNIYGWVFAASSNFGVTNQGHLYAYDATISGTVNITHGSIKLGNFQNMNGETSYKFEIDSFGNIKVGPDSNGNYAFEVDQYGNIKVGPDSNGNYAFEVDQYGNINITSGRIQLGLNSQDSSTEGDGILIDSDGSVKIGYNSDSNEYNFYIEPNGTLSMGQGAISITNDGQIIIGNHILEISKDDTYLKIYESHIENLRSNNIITYGNIKVTETDIDSYIGGEIEAVYASIINDIYIGKNKEVLLNLTDSGYVENNEFATITASIVEPYELDLPNFVFSNKNYGIFNISLATNILLKESITFEIFVNYEIVRHSKIKQWNGTEYVYDEITIHGTRMLTCNLTKGMTTSETKNVGFNLVWTSDTISMKIVSIDPIPTQEITYYTSDSPTFNIENSGTISLNSEDGALLVNSKYTSVKMWGDEYNLSRRGLFISDASNNDFSYVETLYEKAESYRNTNPLNDTGGPFILEVLHITTSIEIGGSYSYTFAPTNGLKYHIYAANFQELIDPTATPNNPRLNGAICRINNDGTGQTDNKITIYNRTGVSGSGGHGIKGWCWVLLLVEHI